jgi:hypothetical protein
MECARFSLIAELQQVFKTVHPQMTQIAQKKKNLVLIRSRSLKNPFPPLSVIPAQAEIQAFQAVTGSPFSRG